MLVFFFCIIFVLLLSLFKFQHGIRARFVVLCRGGVNLVEKKTMFASMDTESDGKVTDMKKLLKLSRKKACCRAHASWYLLA